MEQVLASGAKVKLIAPIEVPIWSEWDDDRGRVATHVKGVIRQRFFKGDRKVAAEVVYIPNETERTKLRKLGRTKIRLRMPSGESIVIVAELATLTKA
jgi:hypothetical protein